MRAQRAFAIVATVVTCVVSSCADLPTIAANTCGNKVVENDEDCDSFGIGGSTACRPAGGTGECRFDCDATKGHQCPAGFGCGADDVCRVASGAFGAPLTVTVPIEQMVISDYDGDGHQDVVTQSATGLRVNFFDHPDNDSLSFTSATSLPVTRGRIIAGSLTNDGLSSLTVVDTGIVPIYENGKPGERVVGGGLNVWRSHTDRSLVANIYPSFPVDASVKEAAVVAGVGSNFQLGEDLFLISDTPMSVGYELAYSDISTTGAPQPYRMLPLALGPSNLAGAPAVGELPLPGTLAGGCDSIVLAFRSAANVIVEPLCKDSGLGMNKTLLVPNIEDVTKFPGAPAPSTKLSIPNGLKVAGAAFIVDVNFDKLNDVVVSVGPTNGGTYPLYVAYGVADGTFNSSPTLAKGNGSFGALPTPGAEPLAPALDVGFIDQDAELDWVEPSSIRFSAAPNYTIPAPTAWTEARILDTNGGGADVIAISSGGLDFYNGTGSVFMNHVARGFDGTPSHLILGDFDGDRVYDICVSVTGDSFSQTETVPSDVLYVSYGSVFGLPEVPTLAGRVPAISQMTPALVSWLRGTPDAVSSIAAVAKITSATDPKKSQLYALAIEGHTDRELTAPFTLAAATSPARGAAFDAAVGTFLPADPNDATASRTALVAVAIDTSPTAPTPPLYKGQIWAAPVTGAAQFDATTLVPLPAQFEIDLDISQLAGSRVVALDLDPPSAGGIDEALIFVPATKKTGKPGSFLVNALDTDPKTSARTWSLRGQPTAFDGTPTTRTFPLAVTTADIDGDGAKDVIVFAGNGSNAAFAKVMFNELNGALDYSKAVTVPLPPGAVAATAVHAAPDARAQIAVLTYDGIVLVPTAPGNGRAFAPAGSCSSRPPIGCPVGFGTRPQSGSLVDLQAADVDGDGVEDLIVASQSGLGLFRQKAVKP